MPFQTIRVSCVAGRAGIDLVLSKDPDRDNPLAKLSPSAARMLAKALMAAADFDGDPNAYDGEGDGFSCEVEARIHGWKWPE